MAQHCSHHVAAAPATLQEPSDCRVQPPDVPRLDPEEPPVPQAEAQEVQVLCGGLDLVDRKPSGAEGGHQPCHSL
eukprot:6266199-Pyramimonas_sp.AAC.1